LSILCNVCSARLIGIPIDKFLEIGKCVIAIELWDTIDPSWIEENLFHIGEEMVGVITRDTSATATYVGHIYICGNRLPFHSGEWVDMKGPRVE